MISASLMGEKETEAQRSEMTCPRSHSEQSGLMPFVFVLFCHLKKQWPVPRAENAEGKTF